MLGATTLPAGARAADWIVDGPLGRGKAARVYRCHRAGHRDHVAAIKVLSPTRDPEVLERFVQEARLLARLDHPSIVRVCDVQVRGSQPVLVMELIEGMDLRQVQRAGAMGRDPALGIALQLARALRYAHDQGVWHRDVKPANVVISADGRAALVDFGLALEAGAARLTGTGYLSPATIYYAPPEWIDEADGSACRWDVYSLGLVLLELLTDERAFDLSSGDRFGRTIAGFFMRKTAAGRLDPGPSHEPRLRALVQRMTDSDPRGRISDMGEVVTALEQILGAKAAAPEALVRGAFDTAAPMQRGASPA